MTAASRARFADRGMFPIVAGSVFFLILIAFWPTVWSFFGTWEEDGMAHGWVIAVLVGWLVWRDRGEILKGRGGDSLLLVSLAGLSILWLLGTVAHIQMIHQTAFVLLMVCWGLALFGRGAARLVLVIGATFLLGLPFWGLFSPILRRLTTLASGGLTTLMGIPARIQGDLIHIPAGTFEVADGCAGLNYLLSGLVIAAVYAHVLVRRGRVQLAVLGVAAVMTIIGNWIRVTALIVIGHVTDMQSGLIVDSHVTFGWLIFIGSLVPFFLIVRWIERRWSEQGIDGETQPRDRVRERDATPGRIRRLAVASTLAVLGPALYFTVGALPAADAGGTGLAALALADDWRPAPTDPRPFDWRPAYTGADRHDTLSFTDGSARIFGDHFVYRKQTQGAKLIGYPNRIAPADDIVDERVMGPVDPSGRLWVRQAVIRTPESAVLTWYWYRVGGVDAFTPIHAKALEVPAFLARRRTAEIFALSAECGPEDCRDAFLALSALTGARQAPPPEGDRAQGRTAEQ